MNKYKGFDDDVLQVGDIGTSKREENIVKTEQKPNKQNLERDLQRLINWVDTKVLPYVFLVLLSGFGVKGVAQFLPDMTDTTKMVVSILAVSVMVVKLKSDKVK